MVVHMEFYEVGKYKAVCTLTLDDLLANGITVDDIFERTLQGREFIRKARELTVKSTKIKWPGCAFSMQISAYKDGGIMLTFSETVEDFVYNLKQSRDMIGGNKMLDEMIEALEMRSEEEARELIRQFEKNIAEMA